MLRITASRGGTLRTRITKLQILTDHRNRNPIFYCHSSDEGHDPELELSLKDGLVEVWATAEFKVKHNPQTKNRIDIYMTVPEARSLGHALIAVAATDASARPRVSMANPHASRVGRMELPDIIWARYLRPHTAGARTVSGVRMEAKEGYLNVDFEARHASHIKMGEREIHLGIPLDATQGSHDPTKTRLVMVDESELQRPQEREPERNPVPKVTGQMVFRIERAAAAGLGELLISFDETEPVPVRN